MALNREVLAPASRAEFATWLSANHESSPGVYVEYKRKAHWKPGDLTYIDLVEECLRIGWIDGHRRPISDELTSVYCTARGPKSSWSPLNIARFEDLKARGLILPSGLVAWRIGNP